MIGVLSIVVKFKKWQEETRKFAASCNTIQYKIIDLECNV